MESSWISITLNTCNFLANFSTLRHSHFNLIYCHLHRISNVSVLLGDGMNAYVAYKVSTRVCRKASVDAYILCIFFYMASQTANMSKSSLLSLNMLFFNLFVCIQTSLAMFRSKAFSVRRRYSDFLGLYEKLSVKQSLHGFVIPPPPEKSVVGGCPALLFEVCCFALGFAPCSDCDLVQQE